MRAAVRRVYCNDGRDVGACSGRDADGQGAPPPASWRSVMCVHPSVRAPRAILRIIPWLCVQVPLAYPTSKGNALARAVLGLTGLMSVFLGLRQLEKKVDTRLDDAGTPNLAVQGVRFTRYGSVPVVILVLAPLVFNKLRI